MRSARARSPSQRPTGAFIIEGAEYDDAINNAYRGYTLSDGSAWSTSTERSQKILVLNQLGMIPNALFRDRPGEPEGLDFSVNGRLRPSFPLR